MRWVVGLAFLLVLSGCAEEPGIPTNFSSTPEASDELDEPTGIISSETGAILGVVTTDELVPLVGANVSLTPSEDWVVQTDESGAFVFPRLSPGSYQVSASAAGYGSFGRKVEVSVEQAVWANFSLVRLPTAGPYVETMTRTGFIDLGSGNLDSQLLWRLNQTCTKCRFPFQFRDNPKEVRVEYTFRPTQDYPNYEERIYYSFYRNTTVEAPSPLTHEYITSGWMQSHRNVSLASPTHLKPGDNQITLYMGGDNPYPTFQQRVDVWVSVGHHGFLPPQWTAAPPRN